MIPAGPTNQPLVSVILPVYNGERFVVQTIESALRQTYQNLEVIVVDDGSADGTFSVVEALTARDSRLRIIRQPNSGVACARNRGLAEARGDFIAPLDADDLWDPTKIERQVCRLQQDDDAGLVYCWWVWIDEQGRVIDRSPRWQIEGETLQMLLQVNYTGNASVPLYRRRCVEDVGGYDETLEQQRGRGCEDWDLALKVAAKYRVVVVPQLLVGYRRLPDSMSSQCEVMWRSQQLITNNLQQREPDLSPALFRQSSDQFALYVAGVLFRSHAYFRSMLWAMRAWRTGLVFRVLPYALLVFARRIGFPSKSQPQVMAPGISLDASRVAEPLIPYDRIYSRDSGTQQDHSAAEDQDQRPGATAAESVPGNGINALLRSAVWQTAFVVLTFLLIGALQRGNDGLWFQGDAPRHAANGFFWWDLITIRPASPAEFAVRYYARYPVINPITYPPLFYVLEGLAFHVFAPSPYVAKTLVLSFGILAGLYTMAWARRYLAPEVGWAGAFLAFIPGVVLWTNAVMLNIPAMALGLGCLYHWRRWIQHSSRKQLLASASFGTAALFTYYQGGIAIGICIVWAILFRNEISSRLRKPYWIAATAVCAIVPVTLATGVAPVFVARHLPGIGMLTDSKTWTFYPGGLWEVIGVVPLALGLAGLVAGLLGKKFRQEAAFIASWIITPPIVFALFPAKDLRYILLVAPAFVLAIAIGIAALIQLAPVNRQQWGVALLVIGLAAGIWSASLQQIPQKTGFREVAQYLQEHAPEDAVVYDGYHDGLFGFYFRAQDPKYQRRLVLGQELFYHYGPVTTFNWVESSKATSTKDIVNILRTKSGCSWVAVEVGPYSEWAQGQRLLRRAVTGPEFELVRSFPVVAVNAQRIDLYRLVGPVSPVSKIDLNFASFSNRIFSNVAPVER